MSLFQLFKTKSPIMALVQDNMERASRHDVNLVHIQFSDSGVPSNALSTGNACCTFSGISNSGIFMVTTTPGEGLIGTTQYCRQLMVFPGYL